MSTPPLLVIGLDGVDLRYLEKFSESLPNITSLREDGTTSQLQSVHPPWTGSAWPSMYTGLNPSHHGVYDFFNYSGTYPDEAPAITRSDVKAPAIWNYLTEIGLASVVLNVPITHPSDEVNGVLIPGYLAPEGEDGHPPGIRSELSDELGFDYRIYAEHETDSDSDRKIESYRELIEKRGIAAAHLLENRGWDFGFIQVQKTDAVFHSSTSKEDFRRIFSAADELIGRLLETSGDTPNVILCSDHGMGPVQGHTVFVNEVLNDYGYIETTKQMESTGLKEVKGEKSSDMISQRIAGILSELLRTTGLTPAGIYSALERVGIEDKVLRAVPESLRSAFARGADWRNSSVYCRRLSEQGVRINLEGRDPEGVVPSDQYEETRDDIIQILSGLNSDSGEEIFEFVCRREDIYEGPYTDEACDILFRTTDMNHDISTNLYGKILGPADTFNHKSKGVFIASGPDINSTDDVSELSLLDIAPTVFSLLRQPIPERMMGTVPKQVVTTPSNRESYDISSTGLRTGYSQDQSEVKDRLDDLGYL